MFERALFSRILKSLIVGLLCKTIHVRLLRLSLQYSVIGNFVWFLVEGLHKILMLGFHEAPFMAVLFSCDIMIYLVLSVILLSTVMILLLLLMSLGYFFAGTTRVDVNLNLTF